MKSRPQTDIHPALHLICIYNHFMQTLVIADIHGCYDEFQALLDNASLTEDD